MIYVFEDYRLDTSRKLLCRNSNDEKILLTNKAYEVLEFLVENSGTLLTKNELMSKIWENSFVEEANVTQTISVLRKKLGETPKQHRFIVTESGKGYRFVAEVKEIVESESKKIETEKKKPLAHTQGNNFNTKPSRKRTLYLFMVIGLLALILISGAFYTQKNAVQNLQSNTLDWTKATNKPLTSNQGGEYFPSFAPDSESFIFAAKTSNHYDIFLRRIGGNKEINLTENSNYDDTQPAFSPDGKQIAFRSERDDGGIFVMDAAGENTRRLCDFGFHPAWSPDGKKLVISERGRIKPTTRGKSSLWIVNIANGEKRKLIGDRSFQPSWSPNGKRIAYWLIANEGSKRKIATISVSGGEPNIIENPATENWNPVWSPDGKFLYYSSNQSGSMAFWRVRLDENTGNTLGDAEIVPTPGKFNGHLSISKDGKRIIYVQMNSKSNLKAVEFDPLKKIPKGESYWITSGDYEIRNPRLSPNGKDFVFTLDRLSQEDIVLINKDGKNWRDLTTDKYFNRYPTWSPDGKKITFTSDLSGIHQIWIMNSDGSNSRQITNDKKATSFPIWSADGKKLIYRTEGLLNYFIEMTKDLDNQTHKKLQSPKNTNVIYWDWSPDGEKIAGRWGDGKNNVGIGYYSLKNKEYIKLWKGKGAVPNWLPDNQHLIFSLKGKINTLNINSKKLDEIPNLAENNVASVDVSLDGKLLYFTVVSDESNIWLLEIKN